MAAFRSRAEEQRINREYARRHATVRASGFSYEGHAIPAPDSRLAALNAAVVKAAMAVWRDGCSWEDAHNESFDAACAALAKAEKE
jgi:hypothetical protein